MKVIVAGFSKTGTKTLNSALTDLGYNVYDFMDHFWYHEKYWNKIFKDGGDIEDFKKMYENVDAIVDVPAFLFWEEISQAFPDAKIVFTTRDEDTWVESFKRQLLTSKVSFLIYMLITFCPISRRFVKFTKRHMPYGIGHEYSSVWSGIHPNKTLLRKRFKQHNTYFLQNAPMDRVLIFNVKQGWDPLCKFLGKEIPTKPFPWLNKDGSEIVSMIRRHPYQRQFEKEVLVICCFGICILAMGLYFVIF